MTKGPMVKLEAFCPWDVSHLPWKRSVQTALSSQPIISPTLFFGLTPAPESLQLSATPMDTHMIQTESLEAFQIFSSLLVTLVVESFRACTASLVLDLVPLRHQLNSFATDVTDV